jgi:hypothetical protein
MPAFVLSSRGACGRPADDVGDGGVRDLRVSPDQRPWRLLCDSRSAFDLGPARARLSQPGGGDSVWPTGIGKTSSRASAPSSPRWSVLHRGRLAEVADPLASPEPRQGPGSSSSIGCTDISRLVTQAGRPAPGTRRSEASGPPRRAPGSRRPRSVQRHRRGRSRHPGSSSCMPCQGTLPPSRSRRTLFLRSVPAPRPAPRSSRISSGSPLRPRRGHEPILTPRRHRDVLSPTRLLQTPRRGRPSSASRDGKNRQLTHAVRPNPKPGRCFAESVPHQARSH